MKIPSMPAGAVTNVDYFTLTTRYAKELQKQEREGSVSDVFDFSFRPICMACKEEIYPPKPVQRCSACKAVVYCSAECSRNHWKEGNLKSHKFLCATYKRHMLCVEEAQRILTQFSWGRLEKDNSFDVDVARGRFGVLGGTGVGFWSHRGGPAYRVDEGNGYDFADDEPNIQERPLSKLSHINGNDLLQTIHLTDIQGWILRAPLAPPREFHSSKPPLIVTKLPQPIASWKSWYEWRRLSMDSPAALLMTYPMSAYWIITHILGLTRNDAGSSTNRVPLHIHMLGIDVQLNFLPLLSELALLLPYHTIKLVLFGPDVYSLVTRARKYHPNSLAAKSSPQNPIFTYVAPKESGGTRVDIYLEGSASFWHPATVKPRFGFPDGILAFNAALGAGANWEPVVKAAHADKIPFATTQYTELGSELHRLAVVNMMNITPQEMAQKESGLNPFLLPGQRPIRTLRLPNIVDGFTMVVWPTTK